MRDRTEGWKYAKLSGHKNEANLKDQLNNDEAFFQRLAYKLLGEKNLTGYVDVGGLKERNVPCILGNTTKSKTDMKIRIENYNPINISIKKSLGGQVYLIRTSRFIEGFENQFSIKIPEDIKKAMLLFWGEDADIDNIIDKYGEKENKSIANYEKRKRRLVATSLHRYDQSLYNSLLQWFKENIYHIAHFCFSSGLAQNKSDWAQYVWYINLVGDFLEDNTLDNIFAIDDICNNSSLNKQYIDYGTKFGGTTIQLPFGFVQWHQGQMQFHHSYEKIFEICQESL